MRKGFGGICCLVIGINPTKAIIKVKIDPILSPKDGFCEKIAKFIPLRSHKGANKVVKAVEGYLYKGI